MTIRTPMGGVRLPRWRRIDLRRIFVGDPLLKSAAVVVALLLWVSAMRSLPPPEVVAEFDGRVPVERPEVPDGFVLRGTLGDVRVRLRGPEDVVNGLAQEQLRATLDLGAVVAGPDAQEAPVRVTVADQRVRVVEVLPAAVAIRLERRVARVLPVQPVFANEPPGGFQAGTPTFRPQEVTVSGAESLVANVTAVFATLRFGDAPVDLAQDVRPTPVDADGRPVEGLEVDPAGVQVSVPVLSTATTRAVPVLAQFRGAVAQGYWISRVVTDPPAVTVSGERAAVEALEGIDTADVDVAGLGAGGAFTVALLVPEGISLVGPQEATVTLTVIALSGTRPFPLVAVQVTGLGSGLRADVDPQTVEVVLRGTVPVLAALDAGSVTASADASGRGPGTHQLAVTVSAPSGTPVQSVRPAQVTVTISSVEATPAP